MFLKTVLSWVGLLICFRVLRGFSNSAIAEFKMLLLHSDPMGVSSYSFGVILISVQIFRFILLTVCLSVGCL